MESKDNFEKVHELLLQRRFADALVEIYDQATDAVLFPYNSDLNHAWYVIGDIGWKTSDLKLALRGFKESLCHRPDDFEALWALGNVLSELGKHDESENCFRRALDLNPQSSEVAFNLANELLDQEKFSEAVKIYEELLKSEFEEKKSVRKNLNLALAGLSSTGKT